MKKIKIDNFLTSENNDNEVITTIIKSATPLTIINTNEKDKLIVSMTWLCIDLNNNIFLVYTTYNIENEYEVYNINSLPFINDDFVSSKLVNSILIQSCNSYYIDMDFNIDTNIDKLDSITISGYDLKNKQFCNFILTPDTFMAFSYIDDCILKGNIDENNISAAIIGGSNLNDNVSEIYIINEIKNIINVSPVAKSSNVLFKFEIEDKKDETVYTLMTSLKTDNNYTNKRNYKKDCEKIIDNYFKFANQYASVFSIVDDKYLMIKASNCNKIGKIFILTENALNQLKEYI